MTSLHSARCMRPASLAFVSLLAFPVAIAFAQPAPLPVEEPAVAGAAAAPGGATAPRPRDTPEMIAAALKDIPAPPAGPFGESWESIEKNYQDHERFRDGKFGIMMHWVI